MTLLEFEEPRYAHVCDACGDCVWLGHEGSYDLYACASEARGLVLIARYGHRPQEYATLGLRNYTGKVEDLSEPFFTAYIRVRDAGRLE